MTDTTTGTNWGRWGADDERGTLNLLTPERVLAAMQVCKTGKVYSLSLPIQNHDVPVTFHRPAAQRLTLTNASDQPMAFLNAAPGVGSNEDVLVLPSHGITHMDALSHVFTQDGIYNGFARDEFSAAHGAPHCDIRATGTFAGRGILLDVARHQGVEWLEPGHSITRAELEACATAQGTEARAGDILLVRTGWLDFFAAGTSGEYRIPGLGIDAVSFVDDHEISAVGADNTTLEPYPFDGDVYMSVHIELLVKRGVTLMEHLKLSELAADGCHEFFLSVGALPVTGAAGSPINPVAIG